MDNSKIMIVETQINEQPKFLYYIIDYAMNYDLIPSNNIKITNDNQFIDQFNEKIELKINFLSIFKKYKIQSILEIHSWGNLIDNQQLKRAQKMADRNKLQFKNFGNQKLCLLFLIPNYQEAPEKYLFPMKSSAYEYISRNQTKTVNLKCRDFFQIFSEFRIETSLQDIMGSFSNIVFYFDLYGVEEECIEESLVEI